MAGLRKMALLVAFVSFGVLLASAAAVLTADPGAGQTAAVTLVGAGDISRCDNTHDTATPRLVASIPGTVFTAGDNVYKEGSLWQFRNCYDPTWGRFKARPHQAERRKPRVSYGP
jgi:acid phosphatase type 7